MNPKNSLLIALAIMAFVACQRDKQPAANQTQAPLEMPAPNTSAPATTALVQHFTCPNNCANSGGMQAGTCPSCGAQYVHNAAFHDQPGNSNAGNQQLPPAPILTNPQPTMQPPQTPLPTPQGEPDQNAAGAWHYICSAGCAGGSGKRGYCSKCGAGLNHNDAYHM